MHGVVAHADRILPDHLLVNRAGKVGFRQAVIKTILRRDAGNADTLSARHRVKRRFAVNAKRIFYRIEIFIRTNRRKLSRAVFARAQTKSLIIVPKKSRHHC